MRSSQELLEFDRRHIWHPYGPMPASVQSRLVTQAEGVYLQLADGAEVIDGMSSWWAACHGHRHPALVAAAQRQIETMPHVMFGGLTHAPAINVANSLVELAPDGLDKVFFADSGSVSVEVAIKMALQYQRGQGHPERTGLLTWRSGYHGDTFGAMSVCDPEGGMHALWHGVLATQRFAPAPPVRDCEPEETQRYLEEMERNIDATTAAIIIEPVVQGAGGMRFHDPALVAGIRELCDRHDLVFIADEIATGFGRTGELFATSGAGVTPDIMCVGKALTGGFMTLAAAMTTEKVAAAISSPAGGGALMHGPTFMANPLACAVAHASVELIASRYWCDTVPRIEAELTTGLAGLDRQPGVADVRVLGAIAVVEMDTAVDMEATTAAALAEGVWLRPFGRLIYAMPPFVSTTEQIDTITRALRSAASAAQSQPR
ncbi:adenosylmethionine--8-amino-7-oxononanoate transaminase [Corynebacterium ciconiae]|uniref:adenosylmethionine--8-amino-7-oxononanoate transaminase n=1 Tax=Corynebacterium ciconiae TaxID=227319 RepID=UPI000475E043|nr:adenosylmethionine--8-amino-7-oxononanoate transaminase [Corynebacterium ciconiae]